MRYEMNELNNDTCHVCFDNMKIWPKHIYYKPICTLDQFPTPI